MKFILLLLLALVAMTSAQDFCYVCTGFINIPEDWVNAQKLLKYGCGRMDAEISKPCSGLVDAADLTTSYPKMYPYIMQLKDIGCKYFCK